MTFFRNFREKTDKKFFHIAFPQISWKVRLFLLFFFVFSVIYSQLFSIYFSRAAITITSGNEAAVDALGQYNDDLINPEPIYTKSTSNNGPNRLGMNAPGAIALDSLNHRLFVADTSNHRVLVYELDANNLFIDRVPDYVLGKANFYTNTALNAQNGLNNPVSLAIDEVNERLFVVEGAAHRVKIFDFSSGISTGMNASNVIGQTSYTSTTSGNTQSTLNGPVSARYDSESMLLYVSQTGNNRVSVFDVNPATLPAFNVAKNAVNLIGQYDSDVNTPQPLYTKTTANNVPNQYGFSFSSTSAGLFIDHVDQRLFVVDTNNSRVLVYNLDTDNTLLDRFPDYVIGQSTLNTNTLSTSQAGLNSPVGITYSFANKFLYVSNGNRISVFDLSSGISSGMNASYVLGQTSFTANSTGNSQTGLNSPQGLYYDQDRDYLFVAEASGHRVKVWDLSGGITSQFGMAASHVLGQSTFTASSSGNGVAQMNSPRGLAYDPLNKYLFVAQSGNHRVTVYDVEDIDNGEDAIHIIGQTDFTVTTGATSISRMNAPIGVYYDTVYKRLFVSQTSSTRVTMYDLSLGISNGMDASHVLGQSTFTASSASATQTGMSAPTGLFYDYINDWLYVADGSYNRVTVYDVDPLTISNGSAAINLLGQYDETDILNPQPLYTKTSANNTLSRIGLSNPRDVAIDTVDHRLFVLDGSNRRILIYDVDPDDHTLIDYVPKNVIGSDNFHSLGAGIVNTATNFNDARGLAYDADHKRLFVAEEGGNKVKIFDLSSGVTDGMAAVNAIGHRSFSSAGANMGVGVNDEGLSGPLDLVYDSANMLLYIADSGNNRVMIFDVDPVTLTALHTSVAKLAVDALGQYNDDDITNFIPYFGKNGVHNAVNRYGLSFSTTFAQAEVDPVENRLFVADSANHRVLVYDLDANHHLDLTDRIPDYVLGQDNFYTGLSGVNQTSLITPRGLAYDVDKRRLFVGHGHRVYVYDFSSGISNGMPASHVLGAGTVGVTNFTVNTSQTNTANGFATVTDLAYDEQREILWVAEQGAHRVRGFDLSGGITDHMNATYVLGQASVTDSASNNTQAGLNTPQGIVYDAKYKYLFVAQSGNHRVTVFDLKTITNGENAVFVLGQTNFTNSTASTSQSRMNTPHGVAYDRINNALHVSQSSGSRVTVYDLSDIIDDLESATGEYGRNANYVIGQTNFTNSTAGNSQTALNTPRGAAFDPFGGRLYIPDSGNHRVSIYQVADPSNAKVLVSPISGLVTTKAGATDTFDVVLSSAPTQDVVISVESSDVTRGTVSDSSLTFTSLNWNVPQTVTVTGVNDNIAGDKEYSIKLGLAESDDVNYDGYNAPDVSAMNLQVASVIVIESGGSTDVEEGGATDSYTIELGTQPMDDVTITINFDAQLDVTPIQVTFTPLNWDVPQTITVQAVDDLLVEGTHTSIITHTATSNDGNYDGIGIADVVVEITDNDNPGITLIESGGSTDVVEGGANDTYDIVLNTPPTDDVVIDLLVDNQVDTTPTQVTFTALNWNVAQTITVEAVDDFIDEGAHTGTITHVASSLDPDYDGMGISLMVNITDNDTAGVSIIESGGSTDVTEGGATDTYDIVLDSEPLDDVIINITFDAQVETTPTQVIFTPLNWNVAQTITVEAVDDSITEGNHTGIISHDAVSTDTKYDNIAIANVTVNITDNDVPGVTVTESGGSTDVTEGGATDSYTLVLDLQPTDDVVITITPDAQVDVTPTQVTFTSLNWNTPQAITVEAIDDFIDEGVHTGTITHSAASSDPNYHNISIANVVANITDNDTAGVTVTESGGSTDVTEGGSTDTYDIVLDSEPIDDVVITITPDAQVDVNTMMITFTPLNWNIAQTITVEAVDDFIDEGNHTGTITHSASSNDVKYDNIAIANVVANITDNDTAGVTVTESGGSTDVTEGGVTDTYDIVLDSEPMHDVVITITPDAQVDVNTTQITFTPLNWNVAQTIAVEAIDDFIDEGAHTGTITHSASSNDAKYDSIAIANVVANITDNDTAGVTVTESGGSTDVEEGGATDTYDVVLNTQPTHDVVITITPDAQVNVNLSPITFTAINWNVAQTITVTAVDDALVEGNHTGTISHDAASTDAKYDNIAIANVVANITDNDFAGVSITESGGSTDVVEGGATDSYTLELTAQPVDDVVITISPDGQIQVNPTQITFTPLNWNVPQTITVEAVDDASVEGNHTGIVSHTSSSNDLNFDGLVIADVTVNITDNDVPGVTVTESAGSTNVTEGGATDTYDMVLDTQPTDDVVITINAGTQVQVSPTQVTFTSLNWNTPQTITVEAIDDFIDEGVHTGTITHSAVSSDPNYNNIAIANVIANITDNDTAGVTVTESGGSTDVEEDGSTDTYDIVLDSEPIDDVVITITPDAQVDVNTTMITFTPLNWNIAQTITVEAIDDFIDEGSHTGTITHSASSNDAKYDSIAIANVVANITDNDTAGVTVTESGGSTDVTEGGSTDTYDIVLDSEPIDDVVITITPDVQVDVNTMMITFTPLNWNIAQTITVEAVDDFIDEGNHTGTITHSASSNDAKYDSIAIANVVANITDNDTAGVSVVQSGGSTDVTEGGATDTYTIVLTTQPTDNVVITISPDAQVQVNPTQLTFTSLNWNTPQTVTVEAIDDAVVEGNHTGTITHTAVSNDGNYDSIGIANVVANITDNDFAPPAGGGGGASFFHVTPQATITINDGDSVTFNRNVSVQLNYTNATEYILSESLVNIFGIPWKPVQSVVSYFLSDGPGLKTLYAVFRGSSGTTSTAQSSIEYQIDQTPIFPQEFFHMDPNQTMEPTLIIVQQNTLYIYDATPVAELPKEVQIGDLIRTQGSSSVYFVGQDHKRHVFPNEHVYFSWYQSFDSVKFVAPEIIAHIPLGSNVKLRPGSTLIKIQSDPRVYAIVNYGMLRWVTTEAIAQRFFGADWNKRIIDINVAFFPDYKIGDPVK